MSGCREFRRRQYFGCEKGIAICRIPRFDASTEIVFLSLSSKFTRFFIRNGNIVAERRMDKLAELKGEWNVERRSPSRDQRHNSMQLVSTPTDG